MLNAVAKGVKEVEVLDAMCGTGKTYNLFKFVSQNSHERYIYVTPMVSEASSRPKEELAKFGDCGVVFWEPKEIGPNRKGDHLISLLKSEKNVSCTHELFRRVGHAGQELIRQSAYIIIIDEALEMIGAQKENALPADDIKLMLERKAIILEESGRVTWNDEALGKGNSMHAGFRDLAETGQLHADKSGTFFNIQLPIGIIQAAKRIIVSTYLFEGSILQAYLQVKGMTFKPFYFDGMELRDEKALKAALVDRIQFFDLPITTERLYRQLKIPVDDLAARARDRALSYSWYMDKAKAKDFVTLGKHIRNTARQMNAKADDLIYTMPSEPLGKQGDKWDYRNRRIKIKGFGPETCYLDKGARATNRHADKSAAIHAYNRYLNPSVTKYLEDHGARISHDTFALAELIQWVSRTTIRKPDNSTLRLHIVSPRMDKLYKGWLHS
ncbi:MAG: hypothetical protein K9K30_07770 [Burkholderiaceae bacterium]|nr:hypothetical protein [Sulfuritalea sp.]MCF8175120.1 hypothetical protein [Burkholderiaceae bacterium]